MHPGISVTLLLLLLLLVHNWRRDDRPPITPQRLRSNRRVLHPPINRARRSEEVDNLGGLVVPAPLVRLDARHDKERKVADKYQRRERGERLEHAEVPVGGRLCGEAVETAVARVGGGPVVALAVRFEDVVAHLRRQAHPQREHRQDREDPQHQVHAHVCARVDGAPVAPDQEGGVLGYLPDQGRDRLLGWLLASCGFSECQLKP